MNFTESQEIVIKYLNLLDEDVVYHDISESPCSSTRLKQALFVYTEIMIKEYLRKPDGYNPFEELIPFLEKSYSVIDVRFIERGEELNKINNDIKNKKYKEKELNKIVDYLEDEFGIGLFGLAMANPDPKSYGEYHNFVAELLETTELE